jgi:hypothetical protein
MHKAFSGWSGLGFIMKNQMLIGIGCFAKPERLSRIFNKLVQDYALGPLGDNHLFDQYIPPGCESADLLRELLAKPTNGRPSGRCETIRFPKHQNITGFYLSFFDQKLNLKIFARGNSAKQEIYTATLDELTKLRQERLYWMGDPFNRIPENIRLRMADLDYTPAEKKCPRKMAIGRLMREAVVEFS